jgi:heme/copper-type cytochrome/quinol oxidase subunit 3
MFTQSLNQLNVKLLNIRVLATQTYLFTPSEYHFYFLYTWSDSIFRNYLVQSQGYVKLIGNVMWSFLVLAYRQLTSLMGTKAFKASIAEKNNLGNFNITSSLLQLAMEKFYIRNVFVGYLFNPKTLSIFTDTLVNTNQTSVISVHTDLFSNLILAQTLTSSSTLKSVNTLNNDVVIIEENDNAYPLFSQKAHWAFEYKTIFSSFSHPFHIVDPSPWPFCVAMGLWYLTLTTVSFFHNFIESPLNLVFGLFYLALVLGFWWRDVIRESTYEFKHTPYVRRGLLMGMLLFIVSEIMFFFGFFWAFFHASLTPSHYIGGIWPPLQIVVIAPTDLPLVNTLCLLLSGVTLTIAHRQLNGLPYYNRTVSLQWPIVRRLVVWLQVTIALGVFFLCCQALEYYLSPFTFQDTVFGGTFYILTGLHGFHVLVGTIFLIVCGWRASRLHFTLWKQVGFKSAVWYWHFVDVVWIFLFLVIYVWGGMGLGYDGLNLPLTSLSFLMQLYGVT